MPAAPPPPPPEPADSIAIDHWDGLVNTVNPERLQKTELARAQNIDLDDRGMPHRRRGTSLVASGNWHSLWATAKGTVLGVYNGNLGRINPDFSFMSFGNGAVGANYLAYVQVGTTVYFSSRTSSGQIALETIPATVTPWGEIGGDTFWYSPVVDPTATLAPTFGRLLGAPPMATALAYFNGRIYLAAAKTVWATELYLYNYVDKTKNFWAFEADVTALAAVQDGLYVGTTGGVWFISGPQFNEMKRVLVSSASVVPGGALLVPEHLISPAVEEGSSTPVEDRNAVVMTTTDGILVCLAGGSAYDLVREKFIFPQTAWATSVFRQQDGINQVLTSRDAGGTPSENTAFGDYLSATLIRNGVEVP